MLPAAGSLSLHKVLMDLPFNYITPDSDSSVLAGGIKVRGEQRLCRELVKSIAAAMNQGQSSLLLS